MEELKEFVIHFTYLAAVMLFIFGLRRLSKVKTARRGNMLAAIGMGLALVVTLLTFAPTPYDNAISATRESIDEQIKEVRDQKQPEENVEQWKTARDKQIRDLEERKSKVAESFRKEYDDRVARLDAEIKDLQGKNDEQSKEQLQSLREARAEMDKAFQGGPAWLWIILGLAIGGGIGAYLAKMVKMTSMPELVAFFNGMGGAASAIVAFAVLFGLNRDGKALEAATLFDHPQVQWHVTLVMYLSILIGCVTLSGSLLAYAKLAEKKFMGKKLSAAIVPLPGIKIGTLEARHVLTIGLIVGTFVLALLAGAAIENAAMQGIFFVIVAIVALGLGVLLVIPIGGADMPVVISLLNSYSGIAASMSGFVLLGQAQEGSFVLIIAGAMVGAAGLILTGLMCKAMNRSLWNVVRGGFGETSSSGGGGGKDEYDMTKIKSGSAEECAMLLDGAQSVIIVPGYGLAVSQAQHVLAELVRELEKRGAEVKYAIHPVAGRMPGHMNVLLAEADVPHEQLVEMDDINPEFKNCNVCIIVGANDVCNPAAIKDPNSPIAGMPILNVHEAQNVVMMKRSLSPGYAGIKNELFEYPNTMMLFSDAKKALQEMVQEVKESS